MVAEGLAKNKFEVQVIGNLTEQEAKDFFLGTDTGDGTDSDAGTDSVAGIGDGTGTGTKKPWPGIINITSSERPAVPDGAQEQWPEIYKRCGGNLGLLVQCVAAARQTKNWEGALDRVVANSKVSIKRGFMPGAYLIRRNRPPLWTAEQWEMVLERITTATHHAVLREELAKDLGKGDIASGNKILLSMVEYNLLALRPYFSLARDLPKEVYGKKQEEVVTLVLPSDLWAAEEELSKN